MLARQQQKARMLLSSCRDGRQTLQELMTWQDRKYDARSTGHARAGTCVSCCVSCFSLKSSMSITDGPCKRSGAGLPASGHVRVEKAQITELSVQYDDVDRRDRERERASRDNSKLLVIKRRAGKSKRACKGRTSHCWDDASHTFQTEESCPTHGLTSYVISEAAYPSHSPDRDFFPSHLPAAFVNQRQARV